MVMNSRQGASEADELVQQLGHALQVHQLAARAAADGRTDPYPAMDVVAENAEVLVRGHHEMMSALSAERDAAVTRLRVVTGILEPGSRPHELVQDVLGLLAPEDDRVRP